jgi:hypothetical protein
MNHIISLTVVKFQFGHTQVNNQDMNLRCEFKRNQ